MESGAAMLTARWPSLIPSASPDECTRAPPTAKLLRGVVAVEFRSALPAGERISLDPFRPHGASTANERAELGVGALRGRDRLVAVGASVALLRLDERDVHEVVPIPHPAFGAAIALQDRSRAREVDVLAAPSAAIALQIFKAHRHRPPRVAQRQNAGAGRRDGRCDRAESRTCVGIPTESRRNVRSAHAESG